MFVWGFSEFSICKRNNTFPFFASKAFLTEEAAVAYFSGDERLARARVHQQFSENELDVGVNVVLST